MRISLAALAAALLTLLAVPASAQPADPGPVVHPEWGSTSAPDGRLRPGCHAHAYSYSLTPPEGDWQLETFVVGPGDRQLASDWFLIGSDPVAQATSFRVCRASTRPGRYTIRALLSVENGPSEYVEGWLPESHFRLRAPHHRQHQHGHH